MASGGVLGYLVAAILGGAITFLLKYLGPKPRLVLWFPHSFLYQIIAQNMTIHTQAYSIQNLGYERAENIEIVHMRKPDFFKLNPSLMYKESYTPSGEHVIGIESLAPKEFFTLEILSYTALPEFQYVRHKGGRAENIVFSLRRSLPKWQMMTIKGLLILGCGAFLYLIVWVAKALWVQFSAS